MEFRFGCLGCRRKLRGPETWAGKKVRCPVCGMRMRLPETLEGLPAAMAGPQGSLVAGTSRGWLQPAAVTARPSIRVREALSFPPPAERSPRPRKTPPPPAERAEPQPLPPDGEPEREFRRAAICLGGFALALGVLIMFLGLFLVNGGLGRSIPADLAQVLGLVTLLEGTLWLVGGLAACFKKTWGVYVILGSAYLKLVFNLLALVTGNFAAGIGVWIACLFIRHGHKTLALASEVRPA